MALIRKVFLLLLFLPMLFCKKKSSSSSSDVIEEVDRKKLEKLIQQEEYLAVFFYTKSCKDCGVILEELEAIDDDASRFGVAFAKNSEKSTAKKYNVTTFPALMYFRNQQPAIFDGDLKDEEKVLAWLTDLDSMELPDKIEEVNAKILENLIEESDYLAVLIYKDDCEECDAILQELENIDDEADGKNIGFVKIADENLAIEYGLDSLPALIYYRKKIPLLYDGDLLNEEAVLNWLFDFQDLGDENEVIEDVNANDLLQLIEESQFLAVLFYNIENQKSQKILEQLENIDDECEQHGIPFVKIDDEKVASEYGIEDLPSLVYFENKIPNFFQGDLSKEKDVLDFLVKQTKIEEIEDVTGKVLQSMIKKMHELVVLFYDNDDETSHQMLMQLENIDDDFIPFVKLDDPKLALAYGITEFPTLVYFKNQVPNFYSDENKESEDIEEYVLKFLKDLQSSDDIKLVSDKVFDLMIEKCEFLAVLLYNKGDTSAQKILAELEHIHDETDKAGIPLVRSESQVIAETYGIEDLPSLVYFESGIPNIYSGELLNEEEVLKWLSDQQKIDEIEDITPKVLEQMIAKSEHLAVLFYDKKERKSKDVLHELENIDDEADEHNMPFVRIDNKDVAFQYGFEDSLPVLVYFEKRIPSIYQGDLMDEQKVWKWLEHQLHSDGIEEVTEKILFNLIANNDFVAVLFYEHKSKKSAKALKELETISDEADEYDILFVKSDDFSAAQKYGIKKLPALLFFKEASPIVYDGNLLNEEEVLQKMIELLSPEEDEKLSEITVESLIESTQYVAVFFCEKGCVKYDSTVQALEKIHDHSVKVKDDQGIHFAKTADSRLANLIGVSELPALVYFEHQIPRIYSDDLQNEKQVIDWIHKQKKEETIENINHDILLKLIENQEYLAVLFHAEGEKKSLDVVHNLEKIDDDCSEYDVDLVKTTDKALAKKYGVKNFPTLVFFRNGQPIKYPGNLKDENAVLEFITSPENLAVSDIIEKVNTRMFDRMLHRFDFLAVYFYSKSGCKLCGKVLDQLEKIDDEAEADGIHIVKNSDSSLARKYGIFAVPALLLFRGPESQPIIYAGDIKNGDRMLEWLLEQKNPSAHIIEEVEGDELRKTIETADHLAVFFYDKNLCSNCDSGNIDSMECEDCQIIMEELENIDSETDRNGIQFVKTTDLDVAKHYGIKVTPALIYYENQVPNIYEGDLSEEEEVLKYLLHQKSEDTIETVNKAMLERIIEDTQYLAVFFYKAHCHACEVALTRLELIDDDTDLYGINVVKICDLQVSKRYGIKTFPALVYFRNGNPLIYDGDLKNEEAVLEWLIDDDNRELPDEIETINLRMLNKLVDDSPFLAVYFYKEGNEDCERVLMELENIDDKCDAIGIDLVKISEPEALKEYNVESVPAFVFFRKQIPMFYDGDLYDEEKLLQWLTSSDVFEIKDEIEEVNKKMLEKLLEENEFIAVFFYENNCEKCDAALQELERIDDEADDELEIMFVKIKDARYAKKLGITQYPTLVYFRKKFPSIYRGNLLEEEEVLDWLQKNRYRHPELNLFIYGLVAIALSFVLYTIFLLYCYKNKEKKE